MSDGGGTHGTDSSRDSSTGELIGELSCSEHTLELGLMAPPAGLCTFMALPGDEEGDAVTETPVLGGDSGMNEGEQSGAGDGGSVLAVGDTTMLAADEEEDEEEDADDPLAACTFGDEEPESQVLPSEGDDMFIEERLLVADTAALLTPDEALLLFTPLLMLGVESCANTMTITVTSS